MRKFIEQEIDLFWAKVKKSNGCWIWQGKADKVGRGQMKDPRTHLATYAHHIAFELSGKKIKKGAHVSNICRNKLCVNPDHMTIGHILKPLPELFWRRVEKTPTCWLWNGSTDTSGCAMFGNSRISIRANRFAYERVHKTPLEGRIAITMNCNNSLCVNPDHMVIFNRDSKEWIEYNFLKHVEKTDTCWLWKGATDTNGYGAFTGKRAHRISFELFNGKIEHGLLVCHKCDNPPCVNPDHLFLGTAQDNSIDMARKGRSPRHPRPPESSPSRKLNRQQVTQIRNNSNHFTYKELAEKYGVSVSAIRDIIKEVSWRF